MLTALNLFVSVVTLIVCLITLNRVFGLKELLIYELQNFDDFMRNRINAFLSVFRKSNQNSRTRE